MCRFGNLEESYYLIKRGVFILPSFHRQMAILMPAKYKNQQPLGRIVVFFLQKLIFTLPNIILLKQYI